MMMHKRLFAENGISSASMDNSDSQGRARFAPQRQSDADETRCSRILERRKTNLFQIVQARGFRDRLARP